MPLVPPPLVALGAAAAQRALSSGKPPPGRGRAAVAATMSLASLSLAGAAVSRFRQSGTTLEPLEPDRATVLVTSGAHAVSRNPMYVGLAGVLVAHAVWRGAWTALAPVAGFVVFIDRVQIRAEEAALLAKFGADYEAYRATSPRWIALKSLGAGDDGHPAGQRMRNLVRAL